MLVTSVRNLFVAFDFGKMKRHTRTISVVLHDLSVAHFYFVSFSARQ